MSPAHRIGPSVLLLIDCLIKGNVLKKVLFPELFPPTRIVNGQIGISPVSARLRIFFNRILFKMALPFILNTPFIILYNKLIATTILYVLYLNVSIFMRGSLSSKVTLPLNSVYFFHSNFIFCLYPPTNSISASFPDKTTIFSTILAVSMSSYDLICKSCALTRSCDDA